MGDVFILSDYGKLSKQNENLVYTDYKGGQKVIHTFNTDMLMLASSISITSEVFQLLSQKSISVFMVGKGSNPNIRLDYGSGKNVFLRQQQYRILDSEKSLKIAKSIVQGKLKNQIAFLEAKKWKLNYPEFDEVLKKLRCIQNDIRTCSSVEKLRGYEGFAAKLYFSLFDFMLYPEWAVFGSRSKRPSRTNVNSVLSFIYSVLTSKIQVALEAAGLDTMAGNLHELCYGKDVLAHDMVEEFRTPFADSLTIKLFNKGILNENDFHKEDDAVYLTREGNSKVIDQFEKKLQKEVSYSDGRKLPYQKIFLEQAALYRDVILGSKEKYIPFCSR